MEVDTGAAVSLIPYNCYTKYFNSLPIEKCKLKVKTVSGEYLPLKGVINVTVNDLLKYLPLYIADSKVNFIPLLGRDWLDLLNPSWKSPLNFIADSKVNFIPLLGRDWLDLLNPSWKSPLNSWKSPLNFHSPVNVKCIQPMSELESKFPNNVYSQCQNWNPNSQMCCHKSKVND
ncbi:hypothetical protein QE152_g35592 [Popillia japonica]|uniref:Peptidase A2 domain-containing protein n=1 Tax=Popillia japonica TaxID=7064 RepID=A0AAW1IF30_POPJA